MYQENPAHMEDQLEEVVSRALAQAIESGELVLDEMPDVALERPKDEKNGDWASTVALRVAKEAHRPPREIAQLIVSHIPVDGIVDEVSIAGPGFINFRLSDAAWHEVIRQAHEQGAGYGRTCVDPARPDYRPTVLLEYVSANPTGPMHVGHGRWAALGSSLARVMEHAGWDVTQEFYINDAGNQMGIFASSVSVRYLQIVRLMRAGATQEAAVETLVADTARDISEREYSAELGENAYGGAYIVDIAAEILADEGDRWVDSDETSREEHFRERAYTQVLAHVREVLKRSRAEFDVWFSERTLHEVGPDGTSAITRAIDALRDRGHIYEKDGATWFRATTFGDDKDRVLVKADGDYTYFAADIAYHADKFARGFDKAINIWGADHHGYVARMQAACAALGNAGKLDVIIGQLVNLLRDGTPVRLSKRAGTMVTFEELLDEVGVDATRYLMLSRSTDQTVDFDIEVAKKQDDSNPVYYVQYAHARICSILKKADRPVNAQADLSLLVDPAEIELARRISEFGSLVVSAAHDYAPFRLTHYVEGLASTFHSFYARCQVITDDAALTDARLYLCDTVRGLLELVLGLLGVSAPDQM